MPAPRPELVALLEAAKDQPEELAPRLVLADWLEEFGDEHDRARAEFVRLHCAWSRPPRHITQDLLHRLDALMDTHQDAWGLPKADQRWGGFHRGMPQVRLESGFPGPDDLIGTE